MTASTNRYARSAGLVDLENLTVVDGARCRPAEASRTIDVISDVTRGMPVRAAMADPFLRDYLSSLSAASWGIELVARGPDAADLVLLDRGREFVAAGYTDLIVAGGDHAFVELADLARLHVLSLPGKLSFRLRRRAHSVIFIHPEAQTTIPSRLVA